LLVFDEEQVFLCGGREEGREGEREGGREGGREG